MLKTQNLAQSQFLETQYGTLNPEIDGKKFNKMVDRFEEKFSPHPAFTDVFTDTEVYRDIMESQDYRKITELMFNFILHSANQKKPRKKKEGGAGARRGVRRF